MRHRQELRWRAWMKPVILDVNEEYERMYGYRRDELVGRSAFDLGLWFDKAQREHIVSLLRRGEPVRDLELKGRTKSGDVRTVRYNGQLIDIGGITCLISAVVDITDRKRLESQLQQAQKLEAVGRLAGGIAHDFNNMLAVILGQADLASQTLAPANPAHESIQEIRKAAERSAELTRQLLVFARRQDAAPRSLDLNQAISERLAMLRRLIGENVALNWNPAPSPWSVKMDPTQVDQILINLAVNARDAIADVGTLTISTENWLQEEAQPQHGGGEGPREWVILTVTDTGTGMGNESLAHIFEPFFTTKEIGKGTGMGLATVYGIVQHNGGRIEVESELGKGTTFRVYLPRTLETAMNVHEAEQDGIGPRPRNLARGGRRTGHSQAHPDDLAAAGLFRYRGCVCQRRIGFGNSTRGAPAPPSHGCCNARDERARSLHEDRSFSPGNQGHLHVGLFRRRLSTLR